MIFLDILNLMFEPWGVEVMILILEQFLGESNNNACEILVLYKCEVKIL